MFKKGFAPLIIVVIIAVLVVAGIGGYKYINNRQYGGIVTTTTSTLTTSTSSLSIIAPAGGEKLETNKSIEIQWQYKGEIVESKIVGNVMGNESGYEIYLFKGSEKMRRISNFLNYDQNKFTWTIPNDIVDGNDYKICIEYLDYPGSDSPYAPSRKVIDRNCSNAFRIISVDKTILNVITPSGNEDLKVGDHYNIQWSSNNTISDKNIEIYLVYTVHKTNGETSRHKMVLFYPDLVTIDPNELGIQHQANKSIYNWTISDIYQLWPTKLCPDCESVLKQGSIDPNDFQIQVIYMKFIGEEKTVLTYANSNKFSIIPSTSTYCLDWDFFADNAYKDGQVHEEIKRIQEKLGVDPVGGHYGPKTQAAIEAFNKKYNIHQELCCGNKPDYTKIYQGTIAKFNELYCDKPLYTIKITRKNIPTQCTGEESDCEMRVSIVNYSDTPISVPINDVPVTIKVPYSAGVMIGLETDFRTPGLTTNANNLRCYISKVYSNNTLVAYYEPGERLYVEDVTKHSKTIDLKNFFFDFNLEEAHRIIIKNVKNDYNIQIETMGCYSPRG